MPTYDYKCLSCGYIFEEYQSITDSPLTECPKCKGQLKRLIGSGAGPIFKGSGFYHTDYKLKSNNSTNNNSSKKGENTDKK
ncbi:MAG: zinc ribbon domain-containing protein [Melioribacter sp.]|nr:zinc ribbon domain-containing protein [Melioribacter sp.]